MAKTKAQVGFRIVKNGMRVNNQAHPVAQKSAGKNTFVYHSGQKVITSPEGVETFADAMGKVMRNYSGAWERLAKK
jgi:hypothetical protein